MNVPRKFLSESPSPTPVIHAAQKGTVPSTIDSASNVATGEAIGDEQRPPSLKVDDAKGALVENDDRNEYEEEEEASDTESLDDGQEECAEEAEEDDEDDDDYIDENEHATGDEMLRAAKERM